MDQVILVDEADRAIGTMEKMEAHQKGLLHRAFSVVLINRQGELLLQKRALAKYHSGGLWTNTCCSHQHPHEEAHVIIQRRLMEEMGIEAQPTFVYKFIYKAVLDGQLTEHECDHVYVGRFDGIPCLNPHEAADWRWMSLPALQTDMRLHPERYTFWFKLIAHHPEMEKAMGAQVPG